MAQGKEAKGMKGKDEEIKESLCRIGVTPLEAWETPRQVVQSCHLKCIAHKIRPKEQGLLRLSKHSHRVSLLSKFNVLNT